jgi:hypothetical protein
MTKEQQKRYEGALQLAHSIPLQQSKKAAKNAYKMTVRAFLEAFSARQKTTVRGRLF